LLVSFASAASTYTESICALRSTSSTQLPAVTAPALVWM
jgi:hypothetical protein